MLDFNMNGITHLSKILLAGKCGEDEEACITVCSKFLKSLNTKEKVLIDAKGLGTSDLVLSKVVFLLSKTDIISVDWAEVELRQIKYNIYRATFNDKYICKLEPKNAGVVYSKLSDQARRAYLSLDNYNMFKAV